MRRFVERGATENREASPRHLPGGYSARARDERQRASHGWAGSRQRDAALSCEEAWERRDYASLPAKTAQPWLMAVWRQACRAGLLVSYCR